MKTKIQAPSILYIKDSLSTKKMALKFTHLLAAILLTYVIAPRSTDAEGYVYAKSAANSKSIIAGILEAPPGPPAHFILREGQMVTIVSEKQGEEKKKTNAFGINHEGTGYVFTLDNKTDAENRPLVNAIEYHIVTHPSGMGDQVSGTDKKYSLTIGRDQITDASNKIIIQEVLGFYTTKTEGKKTEVDPEKDNVCRLSCMNKTVAACVITTCNKTCCADSWCLKWKEDEYSASGTKHPKCK